MTIPTDNHPNDTDSAPRTDVDDGAELAIQRSRRLANEAFDHLAQAVERARNVTVPTLERLGSEADLLARRSIEVARSRSRQLREQAHQAREQTAGYIRAEPLKSIAIATAAGAVVAALCSLWLLPDRDRR